MIDLIYKTVQTIINKENNGYLSPTEFNILANNVQLEIFRNYFEDINKDKNKDRRGLTNNGYANLEFNQRQKIDKFSTSKVLNKATGYFTLPFDLYYIEDDAITVFETEDEGETGDDTRVIEQVDVSSFGHIKQSSLSATTLFPIYKKQGNSLEVFPSDINYIKVNYIRSPKVPNWTYQIILNEPLFDPSNSSYQDFEFGKDEFSNIVVRMVSYFGITIRENEVVAIAENMKDKTTMKDNE